MDGEPTPLQNPAEITTGQDFNIIPGKPFKFKRAIKILGIVVGAILLAGSVYIFCGSLVSLFKKQTPNKTEQAGNTISQTAPFFPATRGNKIIPEKLSDFQNHIGVYNQGYLNDASITYTVSGMITKMSLGEFEYDGIKFVLYFELVKQGSTPLYYDFTENEIQNASVFLYGINSFKEVKLNELKDGDLVTITSTLDLLDTAFGYRYTIKAQREKAFLQ